MGRIFEKRKYRMFARWAKTSKAFTKLGKEIAIAVKASGPDPDINPRLRMAIQTAKSLNMPKDRIQNAIIKASTKGEADLQEVNYEAYAPHGVAIFVETATNNPTRTVANVRSIINKYGGTMGTAGSLDFLFERRGVFAIPKPAGDIEEIELELIDHGLEDLFETDEGYILYSSFQNFGNLQRALESMKIEVSSASSQRLPLSQTELSAEHEADVHKLIEMLEEDDDVQNIYHNMRSSGE